MNMNMKRNFVLASLSILTLSAALIIMSYPVHPPILSASEEQVAYTEMSYPVHPPILSYSEGQVAYSEVNYPVHPPILL